MLNRQKKKSSADIFKSTNCDTYPSRKKYKPRDGLTQDPQSTGLDCEEYSLDLVKNKIH